MIFLLFALLLSCHVRAQVTFLPQAIPLAVRSPYVSCWLQNGNPATTFGQTWPTNFRNSQNLEWSVLVRVDGLTYSFLGNTTTPNLHNGTVNYTSIAITPTQTAVSARAGPMQVNLTFLNPIEPQDWVKQSIPFSYLAFTANSLDGASHVVQVYSDISGEWNSGDRTQTIVWNTTSNADVIFHYVTLQTPVVFTENLNQAVWGTVYYAMKAGDNITYQIAQNSVCRGNFTQNGVLNGQRDPDSRIINSNIPAFAISRDLGTIQTTQAPVVWTVGITTDPAINYTDLSGTPVSRSLYYKTQYPGSNDESLIVDFLNDFSNASSRARQLDNKILQDAISVSDDLGNLVSLAVPQLYGTMQLTVGTDAHGNLNKSDVMMFMKNIGGLHADGNRVNAVETLYAAFPALMYIDPSLGGFLLEPLFRLQGSPNYLTSALADLGSIYPSVSGGDANSTQGVEQTGNMLIMTYAYARASGDGSVISRYYNLLTSWGNYLINSTLFNHDQASADKLFVNNQTNLAIKGIIAIEAMSKMSSVINQTADATKYSNAAASLYAQWKSLALGSDLHLLAAYGQNNSWTLGYNLFADVWLDTNLVEPSVYDGHSNFIDNIVLTSNFSHFGMPVDSLSTDTSVAVSSWSLFAAAMSTNQGLRSELISRVNNRASANNTPGVFPVYYSSISGSTLLGLGSAAQGAVFAPLARKAPALAINANGTTVKPTSHRKRDKGRIVGPIIGGVAAFFAVIGGIVFVQRRRRRAKPRPRSVLSQSSPPIFLESYSLDTIVTPFDPYSNFPEEAQDTGYPPEQQPLIYENPDAEMVASHRRSPSPPAIVPLPQPEVPVPVGLSAKEMARLRAQNLNPGSRHLSPSPPAIVPLPQPEVPVPVGLSDKEMARLRRQNPSPQQPQTRSTLDVSQPQAETSTSPANAATGPAEASSSYDTRRLQSEVESIRRLVERLGIREGLVAEAPPPSYHTHGGRE